MLKHGILGLLNYGDMSGYEIMEVFRDSLNYFWNAQTSQIYRELQTLKNSGFVDDTPVKGRGGDKKIYSITESGRQELLKWLRESKFPPARDPLLMVTFFRGELTPQENIAFFSGMQKSLEMFSQQMKQADSASKLYSDAIGSADKALYWQMTVEYGRMYSKMLSEWAGRCIEMIEENRDTDVREEEI